MNYNSSIFWILFAALMLPYWRLSHKHQNRLLLVTSYIFYGFLGLPVFIPGLGFDVYRFHWRFRDCWYPPAVRESTGNYRAGGAVVFPLLCRDKLRRFGPDDLDARLSERRGDVSDEPLGAGNTHGDLLLATAYIAIQSWLYRLPEVARRKTFLTISMVANLSILAYFKYCDFFVASAVSLLNTLGMGTWSHTTLGILLPAGISFYTFQSMSYAIDIYRKEAEPTEDFFNFALFVCFFPHLVAGPIMRAHTLLPQVLEPRTVRRSDWEEGLFLVLAGMFKKIVIADNLAPIANATFHRFSTGETDGLNGADAWIGLYAFALQIYADFSGYSSVARGISKWLALSWW